MRSKIYIKRRNEMPRFGIDIKIDSATPHGFIFTTKNVLFHHSLHNSSHVPKLLISSLRIAILLLCQPIISEQYVSLHHPFVLLSVFADRYMFSLSCLSTHFHLNNCNCFECHFDIKSTAATSKYCAMDA